jgi:hypothetical protein
MFSEWILWLGNQLVGTPDPRGLSPRKITLLFNATNSVLQRVGRAFHFGKDRVIRTASKLINDFIKRPLPAFTDCLSSFSSLTPLVLRHFFQLANLLLDLLIQSICIIFKVYVIIILIIFSTGTIFTFR